MNDPDRKLIPLLWSVIAILVVGFAVGGFLLVRHTNDIDTANLLLTGDNISLKTQIKQLKSTPTPTPTPTAAPLATPEPSTAPTPKAKR